MGRAQIISDDGDGQYTIKVLHDTSISLSMLASYNQALVATEALIAEETDAEVLAGLLARKAALEKSIERMTVLTDDLDYQTTAWCADYSEGLTGFVGTIEPAADVQEGINIRPGYSDLATHDTARDGQLTPFMTLPVADAILNFALYPAIQKWKPTYRYGTISNIDYEANTCSVSLDAVFSRIQGLDVNHTTQYNDVPIEYMNCHSYAFENGDAVIVQFYPTDALTGQPKVIGFKEEPKPCGIYIKVASINGVSNFTHAFKVVLTQPDGSGGFTILTNAGTLDASHVAELTLIDGLSIDLEKELHVWLIDGAATGDEVFKYFSLSTSPTPRYGARLYYSTEAFNADFIYLGTPSVTNPYDQYVAWVGYPTGDLEEYDFLLDPVMGHRHTTDLIHVAKEVFTNADGDHLSGWSIAIDGVLTVDATLSRVTEGGWQNTLLNQSIYPDDTVTTGTLLIRRIEHDDDNASVASEGIIARTPLSNYYYEYLTDYSALAEHECTRSNLAETCAVDCLCNRILNTSYDNQYLYHVTNTRNLISPCVIASNDGVPSSTPGEALSTYQYVEWAKYSDDRVIFWSDAGCGWTEDYWIGDQPDEYFFGYSEVTKTISMVYTASLIGSDDINL